MRRKWFLAIAAAIVAILGAIQLAPYGRNHANPPVRQEPAWDTTQTRAIARRACFRCHSNETVWPWYSNIAPFSWTIQNDVEVGRDALNFSEWDRPPEELAEVRDAVLDGSMPPRNYVLLHPAARLSPQERQILAEALGPALGVIGVEGENGDDD